MAIKYLFFDMDGTLCKSRQNAEPGMLSELSRINQSHKIFIVSGAEMARMQIQVPLEGAIYFTQNGNIIYENGETIKQNELTNKDEILDHIKMLGKEFGYNISDENIEDRGSEVVVSFTGFNALQNIKDNFDPDRKIRLSMLQKFPHRNAYVAGLTGIDYIARTKGENIKEYIDLHNIKPEECLYIGDALEPGANDYTVVGTIPTFAVKDPSDTLQFIKTLSS